MSDIFQEVDEEVRRERLKKLWDRYGNYVVAAAVVVVLAVAAWRGYGWWQAKKATETGAAFEAATTLRRGRQARRGRGRLRQDCRGRHVRLPQARAPARSGRGGRTRSQGGGRRLRQDCGRHRGRSGVAGYGRVAGGHHPGRYRALREGARRLEPLAAPDRTFHHTAREMLALAAWRAGDATAAKRWFDMILADGQTPAANRTRVEMLMALVAAESKS